jgi:CBS domain-containing protein
MKHTQTEPARTSELHASRNGRPALAVRDIMSTNVVVLDPEVTLREAVELLAGRHISGAPVVSGGKVVGVLSANDVLTFEADSPAVPTEQPEQAEEDGVELPEEDEWAKDVEAPGTYFNELWSDAGADVAERFSELKGPEWDLLAEHTVAEAMSRGVRSVTPGLSVPDAAAYMLIQRIHRAVVLERNELVGIVTATDIMKAVAQHRI